MVRIVSGVVVGFLTWPIVWFGSEMMLSAIWPLGYGAPQRAFQAAIENGGPFTADTTLLCIHILLASLVSILSGVVAATVAHENKRAPLVLGALLVGFGLLKAVMSWPYVPIWYHLGFTAVLVPMAMLGGRMKATRP